MSNSIRVGRGFVALQIVAWSTAAFAVDFQKLPIINEPTSMAVSEDGKTLVIAHDKDDAFTVVDVATAKVLKTVATERPISILYRGDKLLVGNTGKGTISEFTPSKDWEKTNEFEIGHPDIEALAAPQGKFFKGQVIVACKTGGESDLSIVDVNKDKHIEAGQRGHGAPFVTVGYDGHYYLLQGEVYNGANIQDTKDFRAAVVGKDTESIGNVRDWLPWLVQVRPGPFWFGGRKICKGMPPTQFGDDLGVVLVPDRMKSVCYALKPDTITCRALDATLTTVGQQPASFPHEFERLRAGQGPEQGHDKEHHNATIDQFQVAVTLDKQLYVYLMSWQEKAVYYAKADAFDIPAIAESPVADAGLAETENLNADKLPAKVRAGRALSIKLTAPAGTTWELMTGPKGAHLAADGTLTWTPMKSQSGPAQFKIRTKNGSHTKFMRLTTDVVNVSDLAESHASHPSSHSTGSINSPHAVAGKSPAEDAIDDIDLNNVGFHELTGANLFWTYGLRNQSILVLQDDNFRVLDAAGLKVLHKHELERRYKAIFERPDYYVGLSDSSVDLLDKTTLKPQKEIELNQGKTVSLAIHPTRRVCYVSADQGANSDDDPESKNVFLKRPVMEVNEATGEVRVLPGVYGTWIVADPAGKFIYTGLRHMYKNGLDFNAPGGVMNDYGLFDVLAAYDVSDATVKKVGENKNPGINGNGLVISPDGRFVSYISAAGPEGTRYEVPAFSAGNVNSMYSHFKYEGFGRDASYHPMLDLVVTINKNGAELEIYKVKSGRLAADYLDEQLKFKEAKRVLFTPNGKRLLVAYTNSERGPVLQSIALKLSPEDEATIAKGPASPQRAAPSVATSNGAAAPTRSWTSADGNFTVEAQFVMAQGNNVMLKRTADGKVITVSIDKLSDADREAIRNLTAR